VQTIFNEERVGGEAVGCGGEAVGCGGETVGCSSSEARKVMIS
jgi:hypothetical protein